jgi:hypothetical protein
MRISPTRRVRAIADPLLLSSYALWLPALLWALGGFWAESLILFLSATWAGEYHRLREPTGPVLDIDRILAVIALCATLGRFLWLAPHGLGWLAAVACSGSWSAQCYVRSTYAHKSGSERLYERAHFRWHISVFVGQCVLALACYSQ